MKVGLFITCLVDGVFPSVGTAMMTLLKRLDIEVGVPMRQTCCGQMHINSGYASMALPLIENQIAAFSEYDVIVAPSASCVGTVRHQYAALAAESGDATLIARAASLANRTYELSEFLVDVLGRIDVGAYFPHSVTYHPTCHSLRALGVGDRPESLLRAVDGLTLVPLEDSTTCCGFGGTFALKNSDVSVAMLSDKVARVTATNAEVVSSCDSSCLMQIGGGLSRSDAPTKPLHLAEILAASK
ncbi:MAG: (Fe-S)-binding protein [Actinomycetota bacterium]